jgi:hypothetical protein
MKKRKKKLRRNWYVSCNTRSSSSWNCSPEPFLQWVVLEILFSSFAKLAKRNAHLGFYLFILSSLETMEESTLGFLQLQVFYSFSPKKVEFSGYKEHQMVLEKYNRKS